MRILLIILAVTFTSFPVFSEPNVLTVNIEFENRTEKESPQLFLEVSELATNTSRWVRAACIEIEIDGFFTWHMKRRSRLIPFKNGSASLDVNKKRGVCSFEVRHVGLAIYTQRELDLYSQTGTRGLGPFSYNLELDSEDGISAVDIECDYSKEIIDCPGHFFRVAPGNTLDANIVIK